MHIGQAKIPACVAVGQSLMIKTHKWSMVACRSWMETGFSVALKQSHRWLRRCAPADPSPAIQSENPNDCDPSLGGPSPTLIHFDRRGSTKLARAENERFIQQAPLFEVDDQGRQALITLIGYLAMGILDVGMAVPWLKIPCHV